MAVLALAAGVVSGWGAAGRYSERGLRSVLLARELETMGLCANALTAREAHPDRLVRLLEVRLHAAVTEASNLTSEGVRLLGRAPNLRDSARRASAWYERSGNHQEKGRADALLASISSD